MGCHTTLKRSMAHKTMVYFVDMHRIQFSKSIKAHTQTTRHPHLSAGRRCVFHALDRRRSQAMDMIAISKCPCQPCAQLILKPHKKHRRYPFKCRTPQNTASPRAGWGMGPPHFRTSGQAVYRTNMTCVKLPSGQPPTPHSQQHQGTAFTEANRFNLLRDPRQAGH